MNSPVLKPFTEPNDSALTNFDAALDQVQAQLDTVSQALIDSDADSLVVAATALQAAAISLSRLAQVAPHQIKQNRAHQLRIRQIHDVLASRREILIRRSVMVERALAALVPQSQASTYAPSSGAYGRQPYGSAGRQSGEFKVLSA